MSVDLVDLRVTVCQGPVTTYRAGCAAGRSKDSVIAGREAVDLGWGSNPTSPFRLHFPGLLRRD